MRTRSSARLAEYNLSNMFKSIRRKLMLSDLLKQFNLVLFPRRQHANLKKSK